MDTQHNVVSIADFMRVPTHAGWSMFNRSNKGTPVRGRDTTGLSRATHDPRLPVQTFLSFRF